MSNRVLLDFLALSLVMFKSSTDEWRSEENADKISELWQAWGNENKHFLNVIEALVEINGGLPDNFYGELMEKAEEM